MPDIRSISRIVVAAIAGVSAVACVVITTRAYQKTRRSGEIIRVTGSARREIRSDFIIWQCTAKEERPTATAAFASLHSDTGRIVDYLKKQGIKPEEIVPMPINTSVLHPPLDANVRDDSAVSRPITGYRLTQAIQVRSKDVVHVDTVARGATELMSLGIPLTSDAPEFLYTGIDKLKLELLNEASSDARSKAEGIAISCGSHVGELKYARAGVTQIEALSATEGVTDTGANDTSSLDKKVTVVVRTDFTIK